MTRMRFQQLRAVVVLLLLLHLLAPGPANAELEFDQDELQRLPDKSLQHLIRLFESKRQHGGASEPFHHFRDAASTLDLEQIEEQAHRQKLLQQQQQQQQRNHQQHLLELARQKQRGLLRDDLPERPNIIDVLQREAADPLEYVRELERQRLLPYLEYEPPEPRAKPYSLEDETRARLLPAHLIKDPLLDYPETHYLELEQRARQRQLEQARRLQEQQQQQQQQQQREQQQQQRELLREQHQAHRHRQLSSPHGQPAFTYSIDNVHPAVEASGFAVRPDDPRYFQDEPRNDESEEANEEPKAKTTTTEKVEHEVEEIASSTPKVKSRASKPIFDEDLTKTRLLEVSLLPEPQRRTNQDPLVVSLNHKVNNDVYFIAIVAGCSAAAMFALVLISLTWCRIQRVSKAAADVEYPAYGVTGPNKDISPSGDQRLAQSAQMYHFQHQKQQIIAMENRASATRDPGSVSEAESDEENEEGDYTVYECPGLAPTAEMEVKNPLFDDDPTPATPAKSKRNTDDV